MDLGLQGRTALVTGSTTGLGEAAARRLADEGVRVIVHGRDAARAEAVAHDIRTGGGQAAIALGDLTLDADVEQVAEQAASAFGSVDILVGNAGGGAGLGKRWLDLTPQDWLALYDSQTVSSIRLIRLLAPGMVERRWGRIIQVATGGAIQPLAVGAHYAAAKAAMLNATVSLSKALAGTGVTVNSVTPGPMRTPNALQTFGAIGWGTTWPEIEANALKVTPSSVGRFGEPGEVAAVIAFLASEPAGYITGSNYRADGGVIPTV